MQINLAHRGRQPVTLADWSECGARGRRFVTAAPGRVRASCSPALRPVRGVLPLDWDRRPRVTPAETGSQEAWPGPEPLGLASLWREPWWNAVRRARLARREPHRKMRRIRISVCRRSAFLFSFCDGSEHDRDGSRAPPPASSDEGQVLKFVCWNAFGMARARMRRENE